jgi:predicted adenine nucleotide alpha hydrolase (AANH) superfamily ATPase
LERLVNEYDVTLFYYNPNIHPAAEDERGQRCARCYRLRLTGAYEYAKAAAKEGQSFDYVCTTLSVSPHKDAALINGIGADLEKQYGSPNFLAADFKKKDGFKRSLALSRDYGLYRQVYCGCEYSMVQSRA